MNLKFLTSRQLTYLIVECAMFMAFYIVINYVLNYAVNWSFPEGLAVDFVCFIWIILGVRHGAITAATTQFFSIWILALLGGTGLLFPPLDKNAALLMFVVLFFDYFIATFVAVYLSVIAVKKIKIVYLKIIVGILVYGAISFTGSFISGFLAWGSFAWAGWGKYLYSFVYNLASRGLSVGFGIAIGLIVTRIIPKRIVWQYSQKEKFFI